MNWKRNPNLTIGLAAALFVAVLVIIAMFWSKKNDSYSPQTQPSPPQPQPQQSPQPQGPPPQKAALVLFHADWCGGCQQFMPVWKQVEEILQEPEFIETISLEHGSHGDEMKSQNIQAFPTLRLYIDGYPGQDYVEYSGNRSLDSVMKFVQSKGQES